jgi:hypothetical protein
MLNLIGTAPSAPTVWVVQLQVGLAGVRGAPLSERDVEPMVWLMSRTQDVRDVAVVPLEGGVAVAVSVVAADATAALQRARQSAVSSARCAGLDVATVAHTHVVPAHGALCGLDSSLGVAGRGPSNRGSMGRRFAGESMEVTSR